MADRLTTKPSRGPVTGVLPLTGSKRLPSCVFMEGTVRLAEESAYDCLLAEEFATETTSNEAAIQDGNRCELEVGMQR